MGKATWSLKVQVRAQSKFERWVIFTPMAFAEWLMPPFTLLHSSQRCTNSLGGSAQVLPADHPGHTRRGPTPYEGTVLSWRRHVIEHIRLEKLLKSLKHFNTWWINYFLIRWLCWISSPTQRLLPSCHILYMSSVGYVILI
jgi:hypothetical protein